VHANLCGNWRNQAIEALKTRPMLFELFRVMQLVPQGFHDQADHCFTSVRSSGPAPAT